MNNNDWMIMNGMTKILIIVLPFMVISALFRSCGDVFDHSRIESPQEELQKGKKLLRKLF